MAWPRDWCSDVGSSVLGVLSLRHWVPKNLARRILVYWFRRRDAARPDRAAWAVQRRLAARSQQLVDAIGRASWRETVRSSLRAGEGQGVVCPVLWGSPL